MKIKLFLSVLLITLTFSSAYASFPVKRAVATTNTNNNSVEEKNEVSKKADTLTTPFASGQKDKWVAAALWFVLGGFAGHRWYLGSPWYWNVLFILTAGFFVVGWVIDIVQILTDTYPGL